MRVRRTAPIEGSGRVDDNFRRPEWSKLRGQRWLECFRWDKH